MGDDMLVEHGKDTPQMLVKYEDCVQEIALTKADAQATIEALQARVRELEQWVQDQSTANLETMRHTDEMQSRALEAEQQLTQRTAELEAIETILDIDSGKTTVEKVRDLHHSFKQVWESYQDASNEMFKAQAELERVRAQIKAYAHAKIDFDDKRLQEDHHAWRERYNKLVEAENALLQHRQGMEV
jgi:peptidoglycan hydrolase CwlO-like protein